MKRKIVLVLSLLVLPLSVKAYEAKVCNNNDVDMKEEGNLPYETLIETKDEVKINDEWYANYKDSGDVYKYVKLSDLKVNVTPACNDELYPNYILLRGNVDVYSEATHASEVVKTLDKNTSFKPSCVTSEWIHIDDLGWIDYSELNVGIEMTKTGESSGFYTLNDVSLSQDEFEVTIKKETPIDRVYKIKYSQKCSMNTSSSYYIVIGDYSGETEFNSIGEKFAYACTSDNEISLLNTDGSSTGKVISPKTEFILKYSVNGGLQEGYMVFYDGGEYLTMDSSIYDVCIKDRNTLESVTEDVYKSESSKESSSKSSSRSIIVLIVGIIALIICTGAIVMLVIMNKKNYKKEVK